MRLNLRLLGLSAVAIALVVLAQACATTGDRFATMSDERLSEIALADPPIEESGEAMVELAERRLAESDSEAAECLLFEASNLQMVGRRSVPISGARGSVDVAHPINGSVEAKLMLFRLWRDRPERRYAAYRYLEEASEQSREARSELNRLKAVEAWPPNWSELRLSYLIPDCGQRPALLLLSDMGQGNHNERG